MPRFFEQTLIIIEGGSSEGMLTPTIIPVATVFTILVDTQMLFAATCKVDGTLVIDGTLVDMD